MEHHLRINGMSALFNYQQRQGKNQIHCNYNSSTGYFTQISLIQSSGNLLLQHINDIPIHVAGEGKWLQFIHVNQSSLRGEIYKGLMDQTNVTAQTNGVNSIVHLEFWTIHCISTEIDGIPVT
jgi:hypothetical protein